MTEFRKLLSLLVDHEVEFILVGGLAAVAHGSARSTQDVDVVYRRSDQNLQRLVESLMGLNPYLRGAPRGLPFQWDASTLQHGLNFTLTTTHGDLDLLGEIVGGGKYEDLLPHTIELTLFDSRIRCIDLPTLIHVKRAAGRPRDLEAIAELEAIADEPHDD